MVSSGAEVNHKGQAAKDNDVKRQAFSKPIFRAAWNSTDSTRDSQSPSHRDATQLPGDRQPPTRTDDRSQAVPESKPRSAGVRDDADSSLDDATHAGPSQDQSEMLNMYLRSTERHEMIALDIKTAGDETTDGKYDDTNDEIYYLPLVID